MIRVTGLYRNSPDSTFDFDYFVNTHMPLTRKKLGEFGMDHFEIEKGIEAADWQKPAYICITHVEFPSAEDFRRGTEKHGKELLADVPNYTNIAPEIKICEIVKPSA